MTSIPDRNTIGSPLQHSKSNGDVSNSSSSSSRSGARGFLGRSRKQSKSITLSLANNDQIPQLLTKNMLSSSSSNNSSNDDAKQTRMNIKRSNSTNTRRSLFSSIFGGGSSSKDKIKNEKKKEILEPIRTTTNLSKTINNPNDLYSRERRPRSNSNSSNKSISIGQLNHMHDLSRFNSTVSSIQQSNMSNENSILKNSTDNDSRIAEENGDDNDDGTDDELKVLKPIHFKRVNFQVDEFELDPPQQIPSRKPKVCQFLLPYELISSIKIDEGISTTATAPSTTSLSNTKDSKEYKILVDQFNASLNESLKYQQESYFRAKRIEEELNRLQQISTTTTTQKKPAVAAPTPTSSTSKFASVIKAAIPQGNPVNANGTQGKFISPITPLTPTSAKPLSAIGLNTSYTMGSPTNSSTSTTPTSDMPPELQSRHSEENIIIDMPIHRHHSFVDDLPTSHFQNESERERTGSNDSAIDDSDVKQSADGKKEGGDDESDAADESTTIPELTLDQVYTRCCHLREILPIPITLKQLKKKSSSPSIRLPILKFLNPKPTLIDILSFTDFLSIVTNLDVLVFDNVTLTNHMVKIILFSLPKSLKKLSLKNVPLSKENWKILCKYLLMDKDLKVLDISQTKLKQPLQTDLESYLRVDLDWELFWKVVEKREAPLELLYVNSVTPGAPYSTLPPAAVTAPVAELSKIDSTTTPAEPHSPENTA